MNRKLFFILLGGCIGLVLWNLDKVPIAWVDESFLIDPAIQFLKTGHFASYIWPFEGTEKIFLAYLPLTSILQIPFLFIDPGSIFISRLPYFLAFLGFSYFVYKILKEHFQLKLEYIFFLILLIWVDEGFSLALRSARVEVYVLFLETWVLYQFFLKKNYLLNAVLIGLLSIAHPSVWIFCLLIALFQVFEKKNIFTKTLYLTLCALPLFGYLIMAQFDFQDIYRQLLIHGEEHGAASVSGIPFINHFYLRFVPTYIPQPILIFLNLFLLVFSLKVLFKGKWTSDKILEILFVSTSIYWILALAPFPRYTVSLSLLIYFLSTKIIQNKEINTLYLPFIRFFDKYKWVVLALYALPFMVRNGLGILQYKERNPDSVKEWLNKALDIKKEKVLLIDASIAHYYSMDKENVDFSLTYSVKKFDFKKYDKVFYITERAAPDSCLFISEYHADHGLLKPSFAGVQTYDQLRIYRVPTENAFKKLQRIY